MFNWEVKASIQRRYKNNVCCEMRGRYANNNVTGHLRGVRFREVYLQVHSPRLLGEGMILGSSSGVCVVLGSD